MYRLFSTYALLIFCFAFSGNLLAQNEFITTWKTTDGEITIPIISVDSLTYDYDIEWNNLTSTGDGNGSDTGISEAYTISDLNNGDTYEIKISGAFPAIYFLGSPEAAKIQTIEQWGDIEWETMYAAFYGCTNLTSNATDAPNLEQATSILGIFALATSFNSNINNWDVSTISDMTGAFFGATEFNGDINSWDVGSVTNMSQMFDGATSFNRDLNWNVYYVTNMNGMFRNATSFNGDISSWYPTNVEDMSNMFNGATSFNRNLNNWDVGDVLNMSGMFRNANAFNSELDDWYTFNVTNMSNMFSGASSFNQSLGSWNIRNVTNMTGMLDNSGLSKLNYDATLRGWESFSFTPTGLILGATDLNYCNALNSHQMLEGQIYNWNIVGDNLECLPFITTWQATNGEVTIPAYTFGSDPYLYEVSWVNLTSPGEGEGSASELTGNYTITDLNEDDVYEVSISGEFPRIYFQNFNLSAEDREKILTIEQWGDQEWTSMSGAFSNCVNLISKASDTPQFRITTSLNAMFSGASNFEGDLSNWDVSNIEDMGRMFEGAKLFNSDLNEWDVSNVTQINSMFSGATSFNSNLNSWDISKISSMSNMFAGATSFNNDLSDWSVNNVIYMDRMFQGASAFNGDLSDWNVGNVERMNEMFADAINFKSDLSDWDVRNVTEMRLMFNGASAFNSDLSDWNVAKVKQMGGMFWNATSFNQNLGSWDISSIEPFEVEASLPLGIDSLFTNSGLSTFNYDSILIGWSTLSGGETRIPENLILGAQNLKFCISSDERAILTDEYGWTIFDNGAGCPIPEIQASNITFSNVTTSQIDVSWDNGDGRRRLVIAKAESEVNSNPTDLTGYSADANFGNGDELGTGNFVVYNGSSNNFTLTGLSEGTTYHMRIYEYNGDNGLEAYNRNTATGNPASRTTLSIPNIMNFNPSSAGAGDTVTITGKGFSNSTTVTFGGTAASSFTIDSDSVIFATVGGGSSGEVLVNSPGGTATREGFEFIPAPIINSFNPTSASPNDTITINGLNFLNTNNVIIGGVNAKSYNVISDSVITAVIGAATSGTISVSTAGGTATKEGLTIIYSEIAVFQSQNISIDSQQDEPIDYGVALIDEVLERQYIILNRGNANLVISNITSSNDAFKITAYPDTIIAGSPAPLTLEFSTSEVGLFESEIQINNNSFNEPEFIYSLSAEVIGLNIKDNETDSIIISNQDINVGSTRLNVNVDKNFNIENLSSNSTLEILSITVDNPVFQIVNAPSTIAPSSSEEFTVRLNANNVGQYQGIVTVTTNLNEFSFQVVGEVLAEGSTEIKVFNVVTPNGDGRHDFLQIENITEYPDNKVSIFNRWGNRVFEITSYNNSERIFEGISDSGEELISGNYYYVIDKGNGDKRETGFLLIKR